MLTQDNFKTTIIFMKDRQILESIENVDPSMFSSSNISPVLGNEPKYKLAYNNITIPIEANYIFVKVSLLCNGHFYNPYFFLPIQNQESNKQVLAPGRAISYSIKNNAFTQLWLYFTVKNIERILSVNGFKPEIKPIDNEVYIQEYYN